MVRQPQEDFAGVLSQGPTPMPRSIGPETPPWVVKAPIWEVVLVALLCGLGLWACIAGFDILAASQKSLTLRTMQVVDALVGVVVSVLVLRIFLAARARHQRLSRNLGVIADMNHHIRNALMRMQYAAQLSDNEQTIGHIRESSLRIEWALREVLPIAGMNNHDQKTQPRYGE